MKKFYAIMAVVAMSATMATAQNTTRIGSEHKVNFGAYLGRGLNETKTAERYFTRNYGALLMDINADNCNYRTRVSLGWLERTHICPFGAVDAQYLLPIAKTGLYVYPSLGVYAETFHQNFNVGPQAAAGLEWQFCHWLGAFAEAKYQYLFLNDGVGRLGAQAGLKFAFGESNSSKAAAAAAALKAEADAAAAAAKAKAEAEAKAKAEAEAKAAAEAAARAKAAELEAAKALADAKATIENVFFLIRQSDVRISEDGKVNHIANILKSFPQLNVVITGHADKTTGNPKINLPLSEARANEVAARLHALGVSKDRITVDFKGDTANPYETPEENRVAVCVIE